MPKVTVMIPTYNRADFICNAIDSVLGQTFNDYEIIVVDDGSTDNTQKVLSRYNGKIKYYYKDNGGEGSARNYGINKSGGEFIAFLDSDDAWYQNKLESQHRILEKDFNIGLVYTAQHVIDENGKTTGEVKPQNPAHCMKDLINGCRITMTVMVRKDLFLKYGFFDESMKINVDTDMWIRLSNHTKIVYINEPLALWRRHGSNISGNMEQAYVGEVKMYTKLVSADVGKKLIKLINLRLSKSYYLMAKEQLCNKKYKLVLESVTAALNASPFVGVNFFVNDDSIMKMFLKIVKPYFLLVYCMILRYLLLARNHGIHGNAKS